ncbi:Translation factor GUF1 [Colletotrichum shisoi]|uniref:Translation factor GUF1 n=1 Tax=Colletotrichum shisoi TaxID=2078593 RepID=A0A5Q4BJL2_9PEZI|nr:Translation factor GUF1 [Colletotrichum shisoi]
MPSPHASTPATFSNAGTSKSQSQPQPQQYRHHLPDQQQNHRYLPQQAHQFHRIHPSWTQQQLQQQQQQLQSNHRQHRLSRSFPSSTSHLATPRYQTGTRSDRPQPPVSSSLGSRPDPDIAHEGTVTYPKFDTETSSYLGPSINHSRSSSARLSTEGIRDPNHWSASTASSRVSVANSHARRVSIDTSALPVPNSNSATNQSPQKLPRHRRRSNSSEASWDTYNGGDRLRAYSPSGPTCAEGLSTGLVPHQLDFSLTTVPSLSRNAATATSDDQLILQIPTEDAYMPPPLSPRGPQSPKLDGRGSPDGPVRSDFSLAARRTSQGPRHMRDSSRESSSWLDPIDESGGSANSSVHSRSSSSVVRRKHIRAPSGATEAEFDAALDAAVEAAYDDGYEPMGFSEPETYGSDDPVVAKALRKVELAKERVRQTEREVFEQVNGRERRTQSRAEQLDGDVAHEDFYDDGSSDEEERILEEMTRDYSVDEFAFNLASNQVAARNSGSSDVAESSWQATAESTDATSADTLAHPRGGYLSNKLFVPRDVWKVKGVKIRNVEDKVATCDYLTAALLKLARVDTCDADAVLEEMQLLEGILEQVQASLTRKLGTDVGVQSSSMLFRDASNSAEIEAAISVPRSGSVSGKSSSFSWRRLRPKNSAAGLNNSFNAKGAAVPESGKESPSLETLPMTDHPTSRPSKRDPSNAQFTGPNAHYMGSLARLFDAAQTIDQIARQVEDPGLRHADKTQVGLELCTRHAAEFFGFFICRFVLSDLSALLDKFIKRGTPSRSALEERILAIPIERYRNFCIVAHIDHGKSTLSDRLLEITGTISASDSNKQILDKLDVERERGITVKAQTCTMIYCYKGEDYLLHLVDTPGHVDFRAEVTRSYASCGGALLLVDASQGIQAQTVSNFHLAFAQDLALIPVVNKIDMPSADVPRVLEQMQTSFELDPTSAVLVSAKTGKNVANILPAVVEQVPHPVGKISEPLRILLVDSWYDNFRGVILLVRVFDGQVKAGDNLISFATGHKYTVGEVGIQYPNAVPQSVLRAGQVGYIYFNPGMKRIQDAKLGDTFTTVGSEDIVKPYPGFEEPKPMVFVAAFPTDQSDYTRLADSISQLVLNDRSVTLQKDYSEALGAGWRLGFLGSLHCSVFQDRLKQEHGASIIITDPTVPTKVEWADGSETIYQNPAEFPSQDEHRMRGATVYEPFVTTTMTLPEEYLGRVMELCESVRGEQKSFEFFHATQVILKYDIPAAQLVDDLFGKLKGATKGYATLDYEDSGWRASQLTKLQLLVNKQPVDAICRVIHISQAERLGRQWVTKFKEHVDRQMFEVYSEIVIQAVAGKRVVARETIKPFRKDVLAKLHAADITRRKKLLEKQKAGRKRLRAVGNVVIDQSAFQSFLAR